VTRWKKKKEGSHTLSGICLWSLEPKLLTGHTIITEARKEDYAFSHFHNFKTKAKRPPLQKKGKNSKVEIAKEKKKLDIPEFSPLLFLSLSHLFPTLIKLLVLPWLSWEPVKLEE
jgi:hypothetical protein